MRLIAAALFLALGSGCAIVPQNRRAKLADPMMSSARDPMDQHRRDKLHSTREGAAGGDGVAAGGGCGCQ